MDLYIVKYIMANADENMNGVHETRFLAENQDDLREKILGIEETMRENYPKDKFPDFEFKYLNLFVEIPLDKVLEIEKEEIETER